MICPHCGWTCSDTDIPDIRCSLCGTSMEFDERVDDDGN